MSSTTNFATGTAQGAAVAHTYQVGAMFNLSDSNTIGVVVSQPHQDHYGVVLLSFPTLVTEKYSYTILHFSQMEVPESMLIEHQMKLKIASMIYRNPLLDKNFEIINATEGGQHYACA